MSGRTLWRAILDVFVVAFVFVFVFGAAHHSAEAAITVTDDAGKIVTLQSPAKRIATLAPSLTELVFAAGAGAQLVGVSAYSDFPAAAKTLPQVSDFNGVAIETLLAQKPDLVIAWKSGNREKDLQRIRALGIPVYASEVARMNDVPRALRDIGLLAGTTPVAETAARKFETRSAQLQRNNANKPAISVFFEIGNVPLMTINGAHAISEAITLCGGTNIFATAPTLVFTPSREAMVRLQPQLILYPKPKQKIANAEPDPKPTTASISTLKPTQTQRLGYEGINAARDHQITGIDADYILRQGPRFIDGVAQVCDALDVARSQQKIAPSGVKIHKP